MKDYYEEIRQKALAAVQKETKKAALSGSHLKGNELFKEVGLEKAW